MHLPVLIIINLINAYVFWAMWGGFHQVGKFNPFYTMLVWQSLCVVAAFSAYAIHNKPLAQKFLNFEKLQVAINRERTAYIGCIVAAYALSSISLIAALVIYIINGSIDIWFLGVNT